MIRIIIIMINNDNNNKIYNNNDNHNIDSDHYSYGTFKCDNNYCLDNFLFSSSINRRALNLDNESQKLEAEKRCGSHMR